MKVNEHLNKLGLKVKDRVTGFSGVVTSIAFDLYGCIQALVHPGINSDGVVKDQSWFDIARLEVVCFDRVMNRPNFEYGDVANGLKGPAEKPAFNKA